MQRIWLIWSLIIVPLVAGQLLAFANRGFSIIAILDGIWLLAFGMMGALLVTRRPENGVGWVFYASSLLWVLTDTAEAYATYSVEALAGALPATIWMAWFASWAGDIAWSLLFTFAFLLFPTGQLPSHRWRPLAWFAALLLVQHTLMQPFAPGPLAAMPSFDNPLGSALAGRILAWEETPLMQLALLGIVLASIGSVPTRLRGATGTERQQIKWVTYVAALLVILVLLMFLASEVTSNAFVHQTLEVLAAFALTAFQVSMGIAILKYRLYGIDLIIRRTLIYSLLTGVMALVYFGTVVSIQNLFRALTNQNSDVAIVVSTLAIAALFNPLRHRIQAFIDRRFYRRKYDAQQTLAAFGQTIRNEVELDKLTGELLRIIDETMQPVHVSLWLPRDTKSYTGQMGDNDAK